MPHFKKLLAFLIVPTLLLLSALPAQAQNRGARGLPGGGGAATGVRAYSAPRSAPARSYSAPRSAPTRSYSAPRSVPTRSYSAPRTNSNYRAPLTRQSAPRGNSSYRAPLTRQTVVRPSNRAGNSSYRAARPSFNNGAATGVLPRSNRQIRGYSSPVNSQATSLPALPAATRVIPTANQGFNPVTGAATGVRHTGRGVTVRPTTTALPVVYTNPSATQRITNNYYISNPQSRRRWSRGFDNCNDPYLYSNYNFRRSYRHYDPWCSPFLSLGFFVTRPYSYYDYARIDYARPFVYGEEADYRAAPIVDNQVASTNVETTPPSMEQELLAELSEYVGRHTVDGRFQIADPAFGNQMWKLDLAQAPAVYSIDSTHYSVVSGFEGTLGDNSIPSSVGLEFFVARENGKWAIKDAWIVSANGIPRAKKFQSPKFPQVQTWQAGEVCPFSGQPLVPVTESGASRE